MKLIPTLASLFTLFLTACSGAMVLTSSDKEVNRTHYKTYQWLDQDRADALKLGNPHIDFLASTVELESRPQLEWRLRPLIEEGLRKKGYEVKTDGAPDFFVTYYVKARNQNWVSTWRGTTPGVNDVPVVIFPDFSQKESHSYRPGDVYLVLYDPRTLRAAWTGVYHRPEGIDSAEEAPVANGLKSLTDELENVSSRS